ncbi:MAG: type II secretion system F family protein [Pirellulales bacterium]|nr:type II secretion system F family protein [Pirellulales bacterium]
MKPSSSTSATVIPKIALISIIALIVLAAVVAIIFTGPIAVGVLIAVALMVGRTVRVTRQRAFLLMLAEAIERRIPLIPALEAFGAEYGNWRGRTRRLSAALAGGITLPDALRLFPGLVPLASLPLIESGNRAGKLKEALRRAADQDDRLGPIWQSVVGRIFYLVGLVLFMFAIWIWMMIMILPRFTDIFDDFGMQLPYVTRQMIGLTESFYEYWYLFTPGLILLFVLFIYGSLCYVGLIACDLPGTRRVFRRLDTAHILDALALTTNAGQPITEALATLAVHYPKRSIQRRLRRVWLAVANGRDWCDSLVATRLLGTIEAGVIQSAARANNLPWAMRQMADSNRRRFAYRLNAALLVISPVTLCMIGLVVCLYIVACFLPLISLIESLS